jgi:hypothetical protein
MIEMKRVDNHLTSSMQIVDGTNKLRIVAIKNWLPHLPSSKPLAADPRPHQELNAMQRGWLSLGIIQFGNAVRMFFLAAKC